MCRVTRLDEKLSQCTRLGWHGAYCVSNGLASANACFDRCLHFASDYAIKNDGVVSLSRQSGTRSRSASALRRQGVRRFAVAVVCTCSPQESHHCVNSCGMTKAKVKCDVYRNCSEPKRTKCKWYGAECVQQTQCNREV